jgi:predicted Zn-dependent protease
VVRPEERLSLGFFDRLLTPQNEEDFVDGMREFVQGHESAALRHFEKATDLADAAFMAGILSLKQERFAQAERFLNMALRQQSRLGHHFDKYGIQAAASLAITEEVAAIIGPDVRGLLLASAEVHQHQGRPKDAIEDLKQLYDRDPDDVVVRLSLAELLVEEGGTKRNCQSVVRLAEGIENDSEIHAGLLLCKAKSLRKLGLLTAARDTLTATLRRRKNRSEELLRALRYERALVYEDLGQDKRARQELEKLYADAPDYEDVAARLKLG